MYFTKQNSEKSTKMTIQQKEFVSIYNMVKEFHEKFGHPCDELEFNSETILLRSNLIMEETSEGLTALGNKLTDVNAVEYLDALGDTAYVVAGLAVLIKNAENDVCEAVPITHDYSMLEIPKPKMSVLSAPFSCSHTVAELLKGAYQCINSNSQNSQYATILLNSALINAGMFFGYASYVTGLANLSLVDIVAAIHESNMSKLWSSNAEIRKEQVKRSKYDADDIGFRLVNGGWVGYRVSDDKVLKSPDYKPVDLTKFAEIFSQSSLISGD